MITFELQPQNTADEPFIELNKLLKITQVAENGAMANQFISEGLVLRNGQLELRKRAKIKKGEIIQFQDESINVV